MSICIIKDIHNLVVVFQPLTAACTAQTLAQDEAKSTWSRRVSHGGACRGGFRAEAKSEARTSGEEDAGEGAEVRRLPAQGNGRVGDVTAGQ